MGYKSIADIRQGKYFEIAIDPSADESDARRSVEKIAGDVLANPVIEDYRVEIEQ
jgi:phosphoribosylformylglycinamidine synthase